jgi:hypothetical protein
MFHASDSWVPWFKARKSDEFEVDTHQYKPKIMWSTLEIKLVPFFLSAHPQRMRRKVVLPVKWQFRYWNLLPLQVLIHKKDCRKCWKYRVRIEKGGVLRMTAMWQASPKHGTQSPRAALFEVLTQYKESLEFCFHKWMAVICFRGEEAPTHRVLQSST